MKTQLISTVKTEQLDQHRHYSAYRIDAWSQAYIHHWSVKLCNRVQFVHRWSLFQDILSFLNFLPVFLFFSYTQYMTLDFFKKTLFLLHERALKVNLKELWTTSRSYLLVCLFFFFLTYNKSLESAISQSIQEKWTRPCFESRVWQAESAPSQA